MKIGRVPVRQVGGMVGLWNSAMSRSLSGEVEMITEELGIIGEATSTIRAGNEAAEEARKKVPDEFCALRKAGELE